MKCYLDKVYSDKFKVLYATAMFIIHICQVWNISMVRKSKFLGVSSNR